MGSYGLDALRSFCGERPFPYSVIAAPFFLIGSVLWIIDPVLCLHVEEQCSRVGVAAATFFIVDFALLMLAGSNR